MVSFRPYLLLCAACLYLSVNNTTYAQVRPDRPQPKPEWAPCAFREDELSFAGSQLDPARLQCGFLTVAEDRRTVGGRTIRLAFALVRAERPVARAVPVIHLEGGPGNPALNAYTLVLEGPALAVERDVVILDQRGTGRSEPSLCPALDANDARIAAMNLSSAEERTMRRQAQRACLAELAQQGIDPGAYDIDATVADLEALRRALGYERWTLLGESYGGALAQRVMLRHPETVHSALLIKPAPPDWSIFAEQVPNAARILARIFRECAADTACAAAFPDAEAAFYRTHAALREEPWTVAVDTALFASPAFTINAVDFMVMVDYLLYADFNLRYLPRLLQAFAERDARVASVVVGRVFGGTSHGMAIKYTVWCHDAAWQEMLPRFEAAAAGYPEALYDIAAPYLDVCEEWPVAPALPEKRRFVVSDIPMLILSGGYDHATPAATGTEILRGMTNGRQVIFDSSSHVLPSPSTVACVFQLMRDFLADPHAPLQEACVAGVPSLTYETKLPEWVGE